MTTSIQKSIDVDVPVQVAYDQWTQFEDFPLFMKDVDEIQQIDDTKLLWKASMRGVERKWTTVITEQTPDHRVAWKSIDGAENAGVVTFHKLDDTTTRVMVQLDFEPEGVLEHYADKVGLVESRVDEDLDGFKAFIEKRGRATGSWRCTIEDGKVVEPAERTIDVRDDQTTTV